MPPKMVAIPAQNAATVPTKRKLENHEEGEVISDSEPVPSIEVSGVSSPAAKARASKSKKGIATPRRKSALEASLAEVTTAGRNLSPYKPPIAAPAKVAEIKPEVKSEAKPKRVRKTAESVPQLHEVGDQALTRPFVNFSGTHATIKQMRVLVTIEEYRFCDRAKQWQCRVHAEGNLLPASTEMWLPEKHLDAGFMDGEFVSVKVNGGWTEGEVWGKTYTDGEDNWNYDVEILGKVRAPAKEVKVMSEEGKAKFEQMKFEKLEKLEKGEIKEE